ncbi:MAG: hypothetical protein H6719_11785 [Sandaracinaceae bacterium]|nr:hypothetical protein [Sandaracinaceae bacterium]
MSQRTVVLCDGQDPDLIAVATALRAAVRAPDDDAEPDRPGAIAVPVWDDDAAEEASLRDADVAIVLDAASEARARDAGVRRVVAVLPRLGADMSDWDFHGDAVLVSHEASVADVIARGVQRDRVRVVGPIAPAGWEPHPDRAALRGELGLRVDVPWIVVRAHALDLDDLAPSLVQLSLVSRDVVWLFDVGSDPDAARVLRRRTPGHGLDAFMFADGPDALRAYQAADVVLGRLDGGETLRAFAVGAGLVTPRPSHAQLGLAHRVEVAGLAMIADAAATLSVTLDAALAPAAIERARAAVSELDAGGGAARVAEAIGTLDGDERLSLAAPAGLPQGLERLSDPDAAIEGMSADPAAGRAPARSREEDLEKKVDEELAALREKLGL